MTAPAEQDDTPRCQPADRLPSLRAALLCDFLEEGWPSMDLIGEMLARFLGAGQGGDICADLLRPRLRRRFSQVPFLGRGQFLWNADRLVNRFSDYPRWLRQRIHDYDVFHVVDHSYSQLVHVLPPHRTVVTCHDLDTFRCLLEPDPQKRPKWFRTITRRILEGLQKSAHVIAVSGATRDELLRYGLLPPERISVIPNGVHPSCSLQPDPPADAEATKLLEGVLEFPLLLSVGSTLPRKRLDVLLRVFAAVRRELGTVYLVRVGGLAAEHWQLASQLGIADGILALPFLKREILAAVYRRATLLLHTASAEGFGLPLIEAMACGCPAVASDIPVLREVGGSAVAYCALGDVPGWKDTVVRLLSEKSQQPGAWQVRRQLALEHAARYSWADNAHATRRIYRKVVEEASSLV
ncbi:MAG TPA: glycosyltransferase family 1 protein [Bryobacteraceae bacterium]|nr:glycosyltransferase family 1 protein [Bryobacteraceae bacterium]